jgi:endonuclease/exonuclease/phosphatase family metal-dependent hydrolase
MRLKAKNKKLNRFEKLALGVNYLAAFSLLVCYIAHYINPASFWLPAFFSMAYMPILCANAVFIVFWLVRLRALALISAVCILLGTGLMIRNVGFRKPASATGKSLPGSIRVMTYNVYDFLYLEKGGHKASNNDVLGILGDTQPDIVSMQEYFTYKSDKGATNRSIKAVLHTQYGWFRPLNVSTNDSTGLVIFSKYPIINQDTIPTVNGVATEGMFVDVKKGEKIFRVYTVHLQATQFDKDENTYLENLSYEGEPSLHQIKRISRKLKLAFIRRGRQVVALKQLLNACPYPYIITGDFNDTPLSFAVNYISEGLKNAFREKGYGLGVTFYGEYPGFQLDYIMASPQFEVTNYKIIRRRISDHYPVVSDLELK